tara:strand:+ start:49 stop:606 length:558 start_codon:yes stop_codon:yes gene_type:complete
MREIKNVKLGLDPKKMEVIVSADIVMKGDSDIDDLYLIMFNVMDNPLRLSVFTIGNLFDKVVLNTKSSPEEVMLMAQKHPDQYIQSALGNMDDIAEVGDENIKIILDGEENAKKARIVLSSMIELKHYLQKSKYLIGDKVIEKEQKIDTTELIPQLKMMLEIIKRWNGFDIESFRQDIEGGNIKI